MHVLVLYASNSGNTMQAAQLIAGRLAEAGTKITLTDVADEPDPRLEGYDLIVLGSCTWLRQTERGPTQGELPGQMHRFVSHLITRRLPGQAFAVFAFGRHEYTKFCAAADHLEEAATAVGGYLTVDSLRVDGFFQANQTHIREWADHVSRSLQTPA